tara:strand:- start:364 stop:651 length:288 start_codon:yes stop_codon:yes gene_type:complete
MAKENLDDLVDEALKNIRDDRSMTSTLLVDLVQVLKTDPSKHQYQGQVAAKYLETLQRSNEQLVKITSMISKNNTSIGLTDKDKDELFDLIGKEK